MEWRVHSPEEATLAQACSPEDFAELDGGACRVERPVASSDEDCADRGVSLSEPCVGEDPGLNPSVGRTIGNGELVQLRVQVQHSLAAASVTGTLVTACSVSQVRAALEDAAEKRLLSTVFADVCGVESLADARLRVRHGLDIAVETGALESVCLSARIQYAFNTAAEAGSLSSAFSAAAVSEKEREQCAAEAKAALSGIYEKASAAATRVAKAAARAAMASVIEVVEDRLAEFRIAERSKGIKPDAEKDNPFWSEAGCPLRSTDWSAEFPELLALGQPTWKTRSKNLTQKAFGYAFAIMCPYSPTAQPKNRRSIARKRTTQISEALSKEMTLSAINLDQVYVDAFVVADCRAHAFSMTSNAISSAFGVVVQAAVEQSLTLPYMSRLYRRTADAAEVRNREQEQELAQRVAKLQVCKWVDDIIGKITAARVAASAAILEAAPGAINRAIEISEGRVCACGSSFCCDAVFCRACGRKRPNLPEYEPTSDSDTADACDPPKRRPTQAKIKYLVDNSQLHAGSVGLGYRLTKQLHNFAGTCAIWGSHVQGVDSADGWLNVDHLYLPMECAGVSVLVARPRDEVLEELPESEPVGLLIYSLAREQLGRTYVNAERQCQFRVEFEARKRREEAEVERLAQIEAAAIREAFAGTLSSLLPDIYQDTCSNDEAQLAGHGFPFLPHAAGSAASAVRSVSSAPAATCHEPASTVDRKESFKRLSALYGMAADERLAQKIESKPPGTAGSMWSARSVGSTSAGGLGAESVYPSPPSTAKAAPTPPSSAKPATAPPAHRLQKLAAPRPDHRSPEEQAATRAGGRLVNPGNDPNRERTLDQQKLRRKFLKNQQSSRDRSRQTKQTEAVLQEYYWRVRDMEVEKQCRKTEKNWEARQKQRQAEIESKRVDLTVQSEEAMNLKYGRIFATPYEQVPSRYAASSEPAQDHARSASEMEMESLWEAEALGVFQSAYHAAVGRFVSPTPTDERPLSAAQSHGLEDSASAKGCDGFLATPSRLQCLPQGRAMWESPRNPWCGRRPVVPPPVEAVVASLLGGEQCPLEASTSSAPASKSGGTQPPPFQSLSQWKQLPPVMPQRAIQEMAS